MTVPNDPRHVALEACFNFRDIGGYTNSDGAIVRHQCVYRSGSLHRLTTTDHEVLDNLGVRTVIDLRASWELDRDGHYRHVDRVTFHNLPIEENPPDAEQHKRDPLPLGDAYVTIALEGAAAIGAVISVIANGDLPVVVHCHAGKDRTGIIVALILAALDVPDATIVADYVLSNFAVAPSIAWARRNDPGWSQQLATLPPSILEAPEHAIPTLLNTLRSKYGTVTNYLGDAGVDAGTLDRLRARLLQT